MTDTNQNDGFEYRSATGTAIQGVAATGLLAYGLGQLAEGVVKLNDAFGGNQDASTSTDSQSKKE